MEGINICVLHLSGAQCFFSDDKSATSFLPPKMIKLVTHLRARCCFSHLLLLNPMYLCELLNTLNFDAASSLINRACLYTYSF